MHWGPSNPGASTTGGSEAGSGSLTDHFTLEFGDRRHDVEREASCRGARVDPVVEGDEVDAAGVKLVEREDEMSDAARKTVEPNHRHEVDTVPVDFGHHAVQFGTAVLGSGLRPIDELADDVPPPLLSGASKLVDLGFRMLVGRAAPGVERDPGGPCSGSGTHPFWYVL